MYRGQEKIFNDLYETKSHFIFIEKIYYLFSFLRTGKQILSYNHIFNYF